MAWHHCHYLSGRYADWRSVSNNRACECCRVSDAGLARLSRLDRANHNCSSHALAQAKTICSPPSARTHVSSVREGRCTFAVAIYQPPKRTKIRASCGTSSVDDPAAGDQETAGSQYAFTKKYTVMPVPTAITNHRTDCCGRRRE